MSTASFVRDVGPLHIPACAGTLEGFRAWAVSNDFPEQGRICYINDGVLIDMSPEEPETHNKVKTEVSRVIGNLNHEFNLGTFYGDRMLLTNKAAGLSTEPDAMFITWDAFRSNRVRLVPREGHAGEYMELEGSPDWVLEVVSRSSIQKDTQLLREAYHRADIDEYWLINALGDEIDFKILTRHPEGYEQAASHEGWRASRIFERSFRLDRRRDPLGYWQYTLNAKA